MKIRTHSLLLTLIASYYSFLWYSLQLLTSYTAYVTALTLLVLLYYSSRFLAIQWLVHFPKIHHQTHLLSHSYFYNLPLGQLLQNFVWGFH